MDENRIKMDQKCDKIDENRDILDKLGDEFGDLEVWLEVLLSFENGILDEQNQHIDASKTAKKKEK